MNVKSFGLTAAIVAALMVCGAVGPAYGAERIVVDGSTTVEPVARAFAGYYQLQTDVTVTVSGTGSGNGARSLIEGRCDVAIMSRFMKEQEFKTAVNSGVFPVFHTVAMDGIAVAVHPSNPVKGLTREQLRNIYNGSVTNWRDLGGPDKKIVVISRDTTSGTYEVFNDLVMGDDRIRRAEYVGSNAAARERIADTPGAVGYVGLAFEKGVKFVTIDGVEPTVTTVGSGRYPIARPLFMVTDGYPELGGHVHALVTMYLTKSGQQMIKDIGFVPVTNY